MKAQTITELFGHVIENNDRTDLLNYRKNNAWVAISTAEFAMTVRRLAAGLAAIGVTPGDTVGIISNPSPWWVIADHAILLAGAVTVPVFRRISAENLRFEIEDSGMDVVFIGDENEYDPVCQHGPRIKTKITIGFSRADGSMSFEELAVLGEREMARDAHIIDAFPKPAPDDVATIIYTSGSTGVPKGVVLTHGNIISQVKAASERFPIDTHADIALTSLPLSHIFERMVMYYYLAAGLPIYFVDDLANIGALIRDVRPTIMTVVPRLLEKVHAKMRQTIRDGKGIKRVIGMAAFKRAEEKDPDVPYRGLRDAVFKALVFKKLNHALGGRFHYVISGAASLSKEIGRFFLNIGMPLYEGYGMTEASPVIAANEPGKAKLGTVGTAFPGVTVRIAADGEILAKGPNVMQGYHKNPEATTAAIDADGFLHTGDLGSLDPDGYLTVTGRKKELFKKSTGEYVPPVPIEQAVGRLDIVDMAVVVAEARKFVSCLIFPNMEAVERYRKAAGAAGTAEEYAKSDAVHAMLDAHIRDVNKKLHHTEEVQKFTVITAPISIESGEITPTMKVVRRIVEAKFKNEIDEMYRE